MNRETIGARLRETRVMRGLDQAHLAAAVGTNKSQISRVERGETWIQLDQLEALSEVLGVSPSYLLCLDQLAVREERGGYEVRPSAQQQILNDYDSPAGLRELAGSAPLVDMLHVGSHEWEALQALSRAWPPAQTVTKDGWVSILYAMRAAGGTASGVTGS